MKKSRKKVPDQGDDEMFMIFCVLDDINKLDQVLQAWHDIGVKGVTIIESTGFKRRSKQFIPMRYVLGADETIEEGNCTLFTMVDDEQTIEHCIKVAEAIVGDFNEPNTGVFAAWPIKFVKGLPDRPVQPGA